MRSEPLSIAPLELADSPGRAIRSLFTIGGATGGIVVDEFLLEALELVELELVVGLDVEFELDDFELDERAAAAIKIASEVFALTETGT